MRLAVFDIDGTLVAGSTESAFARRLIGARRIGARQAYAYAVFAMRHMRRGRRLAQIDKAYLAGLDYADLETLAARFVAEHVGAHLFEPAATRLRWHRDRGDEVLLLSGTLDCIARPLARMLGVESVCATQLAVEAGRCQARPPLRHPFGAAKATLLRHYASEHGFDLAEAFAYANSRHDIALLATVGKPVAVRPDRELLAMARRSGWEVIVDARGPIPAAVADSGV